MKVLSRCGGATWWVTLGGIGLAPWFPGTLASLVVVLLYWGLLYRLAWPISLLLWFGVSAAGLHASDRCVRRLTDKDPHFIVIDEVSGQWLALIGVPRQLSWVVLAFVLFRVLDAAKPLSLRRLENWPGGWGVMADDIGAGLVTLLVVHGLRWLVS